MTDATPPKEIGRPVGCRRREYGAVLRRTHGQRPALPRLRHPRGGRGQRVRGDRLPARSRAVADGRRARGVRQKLNSLRGLPEEVRDVLEAIPKAAHPMDVLRTGVSMLGCVEPERDQSPAPARDIADRLIASLPGMLLYWYHFAHNGVRIKVESDADSVAEHFLTLLHRRAAPELGARHAHVARAVRRARAQRLDVHDARHRRDGLGPLLVHRRRHRRVTRPEARRCKRSCAGDSAALSDA